MHLLDRLLIRSYLKAYFGCLISLLGLYIIVDLFTHMDAFFQGQKGFWVVLQRIGQFYGIRSFEIFDRLCEMIVLLAAMFTVAWMQRSNELLPLLSAGVSTRRVVAPVFATAGVLLTLSVLNQELIIPHYASVLLSERDNVTGEREQVVYGAFDSNNVHFSGWTALRKDLTVRKLTCFVPEELGAGRELCLEAQEGRYVPPDPAQPQRTGGWLLTNTSPEVLENWKNTKLIEPIGPGSFFFYTSRVDFDAMIRNPGKWYHKASTWELYDELTRSESPRLASIAVTFHTRLTRPILGLILLFMGLSLILRDQNRNVFISAGWCLLLCGLFFALSFATRQLGDRDYLSPALAAWLPVLLFGPLAFAMFDAIHT